MRVITLFFALVGAAHADPLTTLCQKLSICGMEMGPDCRATFQGVTQPYADCIKAATCAAVTEGGAFDACETKVFGEAVDPADWVDPSADPMDEAALIPMVDPVPEPEPAAAPKPAAPSTPAPMGSAEFERLAHLACVHSVKTCKSDPSIESCLNDIRQMWVAQEHNPLLLQFLTCFAQSTCESVKSGKPESASACGAYYAASRNQTQQQLKRLQMIQNQHHQNMMHIIGNMGPGNTKVYDQNGNYLYKY